MSYQLLIIVGPTSSGKSELAIKLAGLFNGEIVSCDSRQIYKGMDLGTGKVEGRWAAFHPGRAQPRQESQGKRLSSKSRGHEKMTRRVFVYKSIPHHLIDFANPKHQYSVAMFQTQAKKIVADIIGRGKLPILCGGTGHWIDAVVFDQNIPNVKPDKKLRAKLEKKSVDDLFKQLKKLDPRRAATIDRHNKRRLIRALEIIITTGKPVPAVSNQQSAISKNTLWIGINQDQAVLYSKIKKRLKQRLDAGMVNEVKKLRRQGLSWKRLESFGLEYKFVSLYLQKKIGKTQMFDQLLLAIQHYAKRQMTWWKRNHQIHWTASAGKAVKIAKNYLK